MVLSCLSRAPNEALLRLGAYRIIMGWIRYKQQQQRPSVAASIAAPVRSRQGPYGHWPLPWQAHCSLERKQIERERESECLANGDQETVCSQHDWAALETTL